MPTTSVASIKKTSQVIVIGAGFAGLTAAYRLFEQGYKNIEIYEARGRVGGRVFSVRVMGSSGESIAELGGQNIPDGGEAPTLKALANEMDLSLLEDEIELAQVFYDQDTHTAVDILKLQRETFPSKDKTALRSKIQDLAARSKNMEEVLRALFPNKGILYRSLVFKFVGYEGGHPSQISVDAWENLYYMLCGGIAAVHETRKIKRATIKGGNSRLALALAKKLEGRIHLSRPLKAMRLSENNCILLTFEGGEQKECEKVILTIPCSVYKDIEIDPQLIPAKELDFIHKVPYGDNTKILLPVNYSALVLNSILTDEMAAFTNNDNHVFNLYFSGEAGRRLKSNMKELYARALVAITATNPSLTYPSGSPQVANDTLPLEIYNGPVTHFWVNDPYAKGSYSYRAADIMTEWSRLENYRGEKNRAPYRPIHDRLFFAGEHTAIEADLGTMEGAVESGERAARMVLASDQDS
ncbi:MAG: FAD-dependent oxidoreductase [Proteobacteria bacterium]|nr:FAD-dependent oxidoreductase [Pseudomonadota bacterium]